MKLISIVRMAAGCMPALTLASTSLAAEALLTNTTSFRIPFTVEATPGPSNKGYAMLFGARDGGPMEPLQRVPVTDGGFQFSAPADGTWQFAIRMTDSAGRPDESTGPLTPELQVVVDTAAPSLNLYLSDAGNGNVEVSWEGIEEFVLSSLNLQYAEGNDGRWRPLPAPQQASGRTTIRSRPGASVAVRAQLSDRAGNTGVVTREIVLAAAPPAAPVSIPAQNSGPWNSAPGITAPAPGTPVGPSPFPQLPTPAGSQPAPAPTSGFGGYQSATGTTASPLTSLPQPHQHVTPGLPAPAAPGTQPWQMAAQRSVISGPMATSNIPGQPVTQLVSGSVFSLAYEVEDVGPSGVSSVELFVTENNGQQWFRYGNDTDLKSPMQVDVQGEGTFGFAIRVRNGVGFIAPPPQPGEQPEIIVTVDNTPPAVEMAMPQVHIDGSASVRMNWNVTDTQQTSVRLEWAGSPSGPWVPVFDWQQDRNGYQWPISANMPHSIYFRLLARDAAGNVGSAQTSQPVLIDLKRPKARMLGVQAAPNSIGY